MNNTEQALKSTTYITMRLWVMGMLKTSLLPLLVMTAAYTSYLIISYLAAHNLSSSLNKTIQPNFYIGFEILMASCIYWLVIRMTNKLYYFLFYFLTNKGFKITEYIVSFCFHTLKVIILLSFITIIFSLLPIPAQFSSLTEKLISILIICMVTVLMLKLINVIEQFIIIYYKLDDINNLMAQKAHTQIIILKRIIISMVLILSLGIILMQFSNVRELGASILASAGIATVIAGFAAQRLLSVIIMGLQIALNQPIKINDYVIVENEFGQIEEITLYHVVIKIWDLRRLIVPINYFIEKPFQNLSRSSKNLLGTIFLYVDYSLPIEPIKEELTKIVNASPLWNKEVCSLQVTDAKESTIELRALVSAQNPGNLGDLRCEIREKLIKYIHDNYPESLPRSRRQVIQSDIPVSPI